MMPTAEYASNAPPGPAVAIAPPDARKRPVPMEPPSAIIVRWRALRERLSSGAAWDVDLDIITLLLRCQNDKALCC